MFKANDLLASNYPRYFLLTQIVHDLMKYYEKPLLKSEMRLAVMRVAERKSEMTRGDMVV